MMFRLALYLMKTEQLFPQFVWEGEGSLDAFNLWLKQHSPNYSSVFILTDSTVLDEVYPALMQDLPDFPEHEVLEVEPGEQTKALAVVEQLALALQELGADRKSLLINLGGGVITDLGAFIASIYMRGIAFVQIPTTVLAQVDASWGGKTGVDAGGYKNLLGTFSPPTGLLLYSGFLQTLPEEEWRNGWAEVLKHGLIADRGLWTWAYTTENPLDEAMLRRARDIKKNLVEQDPLEQGLRRLLNCGHTAGHALEAWCLQREESIPHGFAVAWGLRVEATIAQDLQLLSTEEHGEILQVLENLLPLDLESWPSAEEWWALVQADKKRIKGEVLWSLPTGIGSAKAGLHVHKNVALTAYEKVVGQ